VIIDTAVELFQFSCTWCATSWTLNYEVREITDHDGGVWTLYRHGGFPCESPSAADTVCTHCHRAPVRVKLLIHRDTSAERH
jgi:hypothetical protein